MEQPSKPVGDDAGRGHGHHPWDEVSLPGAGSNASEEPTILQVINKVPAGVETGAKEETETETEAEAEPSVFGEVESITAKSDDPSEPSVAPVTAAPVSGNDTKHLIGSPVASSDNLVSSYDIHLARSDEHKLSPDNETLSSKDQPDSTPSAPAPAPAPTPAPATESESATDSQQEQVFELESHLIETLDEYPVRSDSVGIKELRPIQHELRQGTSKIETNPNVRSVIEVEPAGVKTKPLIETQLQHADPQSVAEIVANKDADADADADTDTVNEVNLIPTEEITDEIKETAAKLVTQIEREVLETLQEKYLNEQAAPIGGTAVKVETNKNELDSSLPQCNTEIKTDQAIVPNEEDKTLSQRVDEQISEVTSILKATKPHKLHDNDGSQPNGDIGKPNEELKIVDVPEPETELEVEARKQFIDSLPQIDSDAKRLAADCKREYYQSLKKYLIQSTADRPPVPLQTYRWEDLRRAKERGGYPWTHLYKRPLGPDEEPEIVLMLRKSQELRFASESPKSLKKVRIDEQILVKETERYIQELSEDETDPHPASNTDEEEENHSLHSESISCVSDSVLAVHPSKPRKTKNSLAKIRGILKRRRSGRLNEDAQSLPGTSTQASRQQSEENIAAQAQAAPIDGESPSHKSPRCFPIMKKLKSMADRQKKRLNIRKITLKKDDKIVLGEETKILKLKNSPKSERGEIPHFIEKQDSDDILEIVELDESPSRKRKDDGRDPEDDGARACPVQPDEIIEIADADKQPVEQQQEVVEQVEEAEKVEVVSAPPKKAPRLRREHVYEEIEQADAADAPNPFDQMHDAEHLEALKQSLIAQDNILQKDIETANKSIPLDRMGSSEEEQMAGGEKSSGHLLAPISSIESTSSDEDRNRVLLSPVAEESDAASTDGHVLKIVDEQSEQVDLKPSIKKEASPAPSDKKVTFSHVEDEAESHREDIELPDEVREAAATKNKWKNMRKFNLFHFLRKLLLILLRKHRKRTPQTNANANP